jgi:hypothetical protein
MAVANVEARVRNVERVLLVLQTADLLQALITRILVETDSCAGFYA